MWGPDHSLCCLFISLMTIKHLYFTQLTGQSLYVDTTSPFEESTAWLPHPHWPLGFLPPPHLHLGSLVPSLPDPWMPDPHLLPTPRAPLKPSQRPA